MRLKLLKGEKGTREARSLAGAGAGTGGADAVPAAESTADSSTVVDVKRVRVVAVKKL
jgi:hypothetical protein